MSRLLQSIRRTGRRRVRLAAQAWVRKGFCIAMLAAGMPIAAFAAPAYIANDGRHYGLVEIVDTATNTIRSEVFVTHFGPIAAVPSPDGRRLYVMSRNTNFGFGDGVLTAFSVLDQRALRTFTTASGHELIAVSPNSKRVYANSPQQTSLLVIDADQLKVTAEILTGGNVDSIGFSPDGEYLYASRFASLLTIAAGSNTVVAATPVASFASGVATTPDGEFVYVAHYDTPGSVTVIATATGSVVKVIPVAPKPINLVVTPNGRRVYVVHGPESLVSVIDTLSNNVIATVPLNVFAFGIDVTPDGQSIYVTGRGSMAVAVISTQSNAVVTTITSAFGTYAPSRFIGPEPGAAVEFYHPALDHYFVTANMQELLDLDNGVHAGWMRTRQSFLVHPKGAVIGSPYPVCRYYGLPEAGLNSHFYSASKDECDAVAQRFPNAWRKESDDVFGLALPDATTGVCPANTRPVYRLWNGRVDSNHRYTADAFTRQQMLGKGYVSEGYGPEGVAMCSPFAL